MARAHHDPDTRRHGPCALRARLGVLAFAVALLAAPPSPAVESIKPCSGSQDWIELGHAEWLMGEFIEMREWRVEFYSKKLGRQRFKWKDVTTVCLAGVARFVQHGAVVVGTGRIGVEEVTVATPLGVETLPREALVAVLPGEARELDRWGFEGSLGVNANIGNSEQTTVNGTAALSREASRTRFRAAYFGNFGSASGVDNLNRHRGEARIGYYIFRSLYLLVFDGSVQYDEFQNIAVRGVPGAGLGLEIFQRPSIEWDVSLSVAYQYTRYITVRPPTPIETEDAAVRLATNLYWPITGRFSLAVDHESVLVPDFFGASTNHTRAAFKYKIGRRLDARLAVIHDRLEQPVPNEAGQTPKRDDVQFIVALGFDLP